MIVIEETGPKDAKGERPFNVYLAGDTDQLSGEMKSTDIDTMSTASFWASRLFSLCIDNLRKADVVKSEHIRQ